MTLSRLAPAASSHSFICSMMISLCRSTGADAISQVSGSNGGRPATNIMLPARVTGEVGLRAVEKGRDGLDAERFAFHGEHLRL